MSERIRLFIPAAGFGERLRPITCRIPKPLLPVLGKPVIERVIERSETISFDAIAVNAHYLGDEIEGWARGSAHSASIRIFHEERILGTGGALKNAEAFLSRGTFLVHNGDVLTDLDLRGLLTHHLASGSLATLAVHDHREFNSLIIDSDGSLLSVVNRGTTAGRGGCAFTGVAVYSPEFLEFLPMGESNVVDAWQCVVRAGRKVGTFDVSGCFWTDIGTPLSYARCVFRAMDIEGESRYIDGGTVGCGTAELQGYVAIERGCEIEEGAFLRNCILLPGSSISNSRRYENCIVGPDFSVGLPEMSKRQLVNEAEGTWIGTGGSDRKYFRISWGDQTAVLMQCATGDPDYERHLEYTRFFLENGIPVPHILAINPERMSATFEDLGDTSLYSWLRCPRTPEQVTSMYRDVLNVLALVHSVSREAVMSRCSPHWRVFDRDYFRWETSYFLESFLGGVLGMQMIGRTVIEEELDRLAGRADSFCKRVLHRDFQSQNIMIVAEEPRIIDYQGTRIGPPAYDLVSLLWDPYSPMTGTMRSPLISHYVDVMTEREGSDFDPVDLHSSLAVCRLQRHMQALGAYGYLAVVKGKRYFLKHVPEALRLLREDVEDMDHEYPALCELVRSLCSCNGMSPHFSVE